MIIIAWLVIAAIFIGVPGVYYLQMRKWSKRPWKLDIDKSYQPSVVILVPVHNEEKTIRLKLENLSNVKYPDGKIETVILNDASTDNTLTEINQYKTLNSSAKIKILDFKEHLGKTECLNQALKSVSADVLIISDADCFWPSDILLKALPYLSDPNVGAITGRELLLNPQSSWITAGEKFYDVNVQALRIGESKMHSTLFFQGGFAAYKSNILHTFDHEADDSGTALDIIQRNSRTLLLPEVGFYTTFPTIWRNKITLKIRRASQLQHLWMKCLKLLLRGKLTIPKRIAIPEIFLHIFNPIVALTLIIVGVFAIFEQPLLFLSFLLLIPAMLIPKTRITIIELVQNNLILLFALQSFLRKGKFGLWKPVQETRTLIDRNILQQNNLI